MPGGYTRRAKSEPANEGRAIEGTFCFVDIAGYTALTDMHGEVAAGDLHFNHRAYGFCSLACVERFARQPEAYVPAADAAP